MQDRTETQDKIERAIFAKMLDGSEFEAAAEATFEEFHGDMMSIGGWSAGCEIDGQEYEVEADWLWRRNYPR